MILLDKPYVSQLLLDTIAEHSLPVVSTESARPFGVQGMSSALSEEEAVERALARPDPLVYTVSESSIAWIAESLGDTVLPERIDRFKNKARFRELTADLFPGLRFLEVGVGDLDDFDPSSFPMPFIIKPAVGFLSLGVRRVNSVDEWQPALAAIRHDLHQAEGMFPAQVLNSSSFLIESCIEGQEFAIDAYYDEHGEPVVLSVLEHLFADPDDTADRVYVTSAEIVRSNLQRFTDLLMDLGAIFAPRNFPVHVEVRVDGSGQLWPIEVNPVRFGGWCTTADLTHHAYGLNPYVCLFAQSRPDWDELLKGKEGQLFALVALGNSTGIKGRDVEAFDHDGVLAHFAHPLELRKVDHGEYPLFGFVYVRTSSEDTAELDWALHTDLREFVTTSHAGS